METGVDCGMSNKSHLREPTLIPGVETAQSSRKISSESQTYDPVRAESHRFQRGRSCPSAGAANSLDRSVEIDAPQWRCWRRRSVVDVRERSCSGSRLVGGWVKMLAPRYVVGWWGRGRRRWDLFCIVCAGRSLSTWRQGCGAEQERK